MLGLPLCQWFGIACVGVILLACGGSKVTPEGPASPATSARRSLSDDCALLPGKPAPEPLKRQYEGLASKARCQREVYGIMGGVTHFLGVKCNYCHLEPNYELMTHRKRVANWMARELIPRLEAKGGERVWCGNCHEHRGKGTAKLLGNPRNQRWAVQWMLTHLTGSLEASGGRPLQCRDCHGGELGSREFQRGIILKPLPREPRSK